MGRGGLRITHLLFGNDCMIFGRASRKEWIKISNILEIYKAASGQCLNRSKTTIFFRSNINNSEKQLIKRGGSKHHQ